MSYPGYPSYPGSGPGYPINPPPGAVVCPPGPPGFQPPQAAGYPVGVPSTIAPYGQAYPPTSVPGYSPAPAGVGYPPSSSGYPPASSNTTYPSAGFSIGGSQPGYPPAEGQQTANPPTGSQPTGYPPAGGPPTGYPPAGGPPTGYPPAGAQSPGYPHSGGQPTGYPPAGSQPTGYLPTGQPTGYPSTGGVGFPPTTGFPSYAPTMGSGYPSVGGPSPFPQMGIGLTPGAVSTSVPQGGMYPSIGQKEKQPEIGDFGTSVPRASFGSAPKDIPTVRPVQPFDPASDAQNLRKAMKGFGTDEKAIIGILTKRNNIQRQQIAIAFKTAYGKDLISDLKSELSGNLEKVILALMMPLDQYRADQIYKAVAGLGTDEETLIEILCTCTNQEIRNLNATYQKYYKHPLESDIKGDTSGHMRRLLVSLCVGNRDESNVVDVARAHQMAQQLYQAGQKHLGTDESTFNAVLATQNYAMLRQVFQEYQRLTGHSFTTALKRELSGDLLDGMLTITSVAENKHAYFANRLYRSMSGMGTDDENLIRVVVMRSEIDMGNIKQEFQRIFGKPLQSAISSDTSGDYKKILLALIE